MGNTVNSSGDNATESKKDETPTFNKLYHFVLENKDEQDLSEEANFSRFLFCEFFYI